MAPISAEFLSSRVEPLLTGSGSNQGSEQSYKLDLKMCRLQSLDLPASPTSITSQGPTPELSYLSVVGRVYILNVSLNDLSRLDHRSLQTLPNLQYIDASLNRLTRVDDLSSLAKLRILNLSYNKLKDITFVASLTSLVELTLSMNEITSISSLPTLVHLQIVNLSDNQLVSLDGIQNLPYLKELNVQRNNISSLLPLSTNINLTYLNASSNLLHNLKSTISALSSLTQLSLLLLVGNPITNDRDYALEMRRLPSLVSLDNFSLHRAPSYAAQLSQGQPWPPSAVAGGIDPTTDPMALLAEKKAAKERNIQRLEQQIRQEEQSFRDFEAFVQRSAVGPAGQAADVYVYGSVPGAVTSGGVGGDPRSTASGTGDHTGYAGSDIQRRSDRRGLYYNNQPVRLSQRRASPRPSDGEEHRKENYRDVTDTDEVLRLASNELAKDVFNDPVK